MKTKLCPACQAEIGRTFSVCPECKQPCTKPKYVPKKVRGFKAEKRARQKRKAARVPSMKALSDKVCAPVVTPLTHVQTTLAALDAVLDLEGAEPMLVLAWQSHREAVAMVGAA